MRARGGQRERKYARSETLESILRVQNCLIRQSLDVEPRLAARSIRRSTAGLLGIIPLATVKGDSHIDLSADIDRSFRRSKRKRTCRSSSA